MDLISDRRALHRIPELDRNLPETLDYLRSALEPLPCKVFSPAESALCAFFDFGRTTAWPSGEIWTPCRFPKPQACPSPPAILAKCTPAATTATWLSPWSWPGGWPGGKSSPTTCFWFSSLRRKPLAAPRPFATAAFLINIAQRPSLAYTYGRTFRQACSPPSPAG